MKLKVYRASGAPVKEGNIEKWTTEYNAFYDKAQKKYMPDLTRAPSAEEATNMQSVLKKYEKRLYRKYPATEDWEFIKSKRAWNNKLKEVNFPIALAVNQETKQLVYVIMDIDF